MLFLVLICQIIWASFASSQLHVSPQNSLVFGPGLNPNFNVPARYFFIQAVDQHHRNFTDSVGQFKVEIFGRASQVCRVWSQVLDRQDGTYIIRFKLFETCLSGLHISISYKSMPVGHSPYLLNGPVYDEECNCPIDRPEWMSQMACPSIYPQILKDLEPYPEVDMEQVVRVAAHKFRFAGSHSICHYVVKDNQVYRKCFGEHVGFNMFMDNILLSLARKTKLADIELVVNLGDWPLEMKRFNEEPLPIFSWCGSNDTFDIVMPTYDITESTLDAMGRVTLDMLSVQGNTGPIWDDKIELGFWRGRDSRRERLNLIKLGREYPDLINASLTNFFFFRDEMDDFGPTVKHISFFDFFKFKYQINIDGTVAAYRLPYLLAGDSVVLKQESPYYEHFYAQLKPWKHYIPFKRDLSDLTRKLKWVKYNDEKAKKIARNGRKFAQDNLLAADVLCYHVMLFEEFSKRIKHPVTVKKDMELIPQPDQNVRRVCKCLNSQKMKDEL